MNTKTQYSDIISKGFTDKSSYLAWRTAWRAHYAIISTEIREAKAGRKNEDEGFKRWCQGHAYQLRVEARGLMEQRALSKVEAQRQCLSAKAAQVPASV